MRLAKTLNSAEAESWAIWRERERQWPNLGNPGAIKWGEEFCTTLLLTALDRAAQMRQHQFTRHDESRVGADWEWWVGSNHFTWRAIRVQAKIASPQGAAGNPHYAMLDHRVVVQETPVRVTELQHDILLREAAAGHNAKGDPAGLPVAPYYCFFHGWPNLGAASPITSTWASARRTAHEALVNAHTCHLPAECPLALLESMSSGPLMRRWATATGTGTPGGTTPWKWWGAAGLPAARVLNTADKLVSSYSDELLPITYVILEELAQLCRHGGAAGPVGGPAGGPGGGGGPAGGPPAPRDDDGPGARAVTDDEDRNDGGVPALPDYAQAVANPDAPQSQEVLQLLDTTGALGVRSVGVLDIGAPE